MNELWLQCSACASDRCELFAFRHVSLPPVDQRLQHTTHVYLSERCKSCQKQWLKKRKRKAWQHVMWRRWDLDMKDHLGIVSNKQSVLVSLCCSCAYSKHNFSRSGGGRSHQAPFHNRHLHFGKHCTFFFSPSWHRNPLKFKYNMHINVSSDR